jgi:CCR4-NOT transcription complex subunit 1
MPKLLIANNEEAWKKFHCLLISLFEFLKPHLRKIQLTFPIQLVYRGTLKILLVLLHDFPEFLCDFHLSLTISIPTVCIHLRNPILSAFPRHMKLPDPFSSKFKVDLLPEIEQSPRILSDYAANFTPELPQNMVEKIYETQDENLISQLPQKLKLKSEEVEKEGSNYNVPLMNSVVLQMAIMGINEMKTKSANFLELPTTNIFSKLVKQLDAEGRYLFLNSLTNQLRYPNNHTHFFSWIILYLFSEVHIDNNSSNQDLQEQITRVLLERLIVFRPHPWGVLITFIELVKNRSYKFWERPFIYCAREIELLFYNIKQETTNHSS